MDTLFNRIAKETGLNIEQITNTIKLLDEGSTVPFIARYRKEVTGNLDETNILKISELIVYLRNLETRKEEVIRLIEEQGKLTEELKKQIQLAEKLQNVEDLYFPFKKKRKTKADTAKEQGLEPLAQKIYELKTIADLEKEAQKFITDEVESIEKAIEGAKLIVAQNLSETLEYREKLREEMLKKAIIVAKKSKKADELDVKHVYKDYYEYTEPVNKALSHRILALNRGENEGVLTISLNFEEKDREILERYLLKDFVNKELNFFHKEIVIDALDRLILPSIEREVRNILTEKAEDEAIIVFKENLKNLLMQPPLYEKNILALDPGYRTGCKVAVIDKNGFFRENTVFYLVKEMHHENQLKDAERKMKDFIKKYEIDIIVIGNGTASRETESFVAEVLKTVDRDVKYLIGNEAGASIYSASKIAVEEFPDLDVTVRGAISIGRRIQDPLAELVKIDPKSIGVGMYQHDVNQKRLDQSLTEVIELVVNSVGVNVNTASWALLSYVSGVKKSVAKSIVDYRKENGNFKNRKELLKVKGLGAKAYEQMAGFLIILDGENTLDNTIIHPESYNTAEKILKSIGLSLKNYADELNKAKEILANFDYKKFAQENDCGYETVKDIYDALVKERRDPRDSIQKPLLKSDILKIDNLQPGMELEGTVRNVVKFGAFIDIGLKNDALLHISEISDRFIDDPGKVLSVGQIIKVKIKDIDKERERVGLTKKGL
ncbi:RNA-binding transcriptional accessory protein [Cetobacterium somerae]|uniref:Tex family protein n=1 Tax=Cetobacterium sp. NK01 TaxID=2993530 RepID=UPI002116B580|nr:Tex family protein [Cetobacterium sp. NK01]MCQ8211570.1 RNA-binding transcriptional accessory protein [Cetobacterium sp. NK01]